jgi:hypothetical protein
MRPYLSLLLAHLLAASAFADWRADADARIEKHRKRDFVLTLIGPDGAPLPATNISIRQTRNSFGFGTCVHGGMEADTPDWRRLRQFVLDHFSMLVCENAMKWFDIEKERGRRDFGPADAIVKFAQENGLPLRGHCIAWEKTKWTRPWQHDLPPEQLKKVLNKHIEAVAGRYKGKLIAWDVHNEVLNGEFYTGKFGESIRPWFFKRVREVDPNAVLFTNDSRDGQAERHTSAGRKLILGSAARRGGWLPFVAPHAFPSPTRPSGPQHHFRAVETNGSPAHGNHFAIALAGAGQRRGGLLLESDDGEDGHRRKRSALGFLLSLSQLLQKRIIPA